jgi:MFS family permease
LGTSIGHFLNDGANYLFPAVYPVLLNSYHVSLSFIGILAALYSLSSLVSSPFIGKRSDYNRSYLTLIPVGLSIVALGILGFTISVVFFSGSLFYVGLVLFSLLGGFGSSFYHPLAAAILNEAFSADRRGRAMGINGSLGGFGSFAFPIITVGLIASYGVISLTLIALVFFLLAIAIYSVMRSIKVNAAFTDKSDQRDSRVTYRFVLPFVLALTLSGFLRNLCTQGVISFLPTYLNTVSKINYQYIGYALIAFSVAAIVGQPLFGWLSDHFGRLPMLVVTCIGAVGSILLLALTPGNFWLTEISIALFGLFSYTNFPLFLGLTGVIAPKGTITLANSIVWGFGMIGGGTVGPILVGVLSDKAFLGSLDQAFLVLAAAGFASLVFLPFVPKPKKAQTVAP